MGKREGMVRREEDAIKQSLQKAAEAEQIPESLQPKQMEAWLKEAAARKGLPGQEAPARPEGGQGGPHPTRAKKHYRKWWYGTAAAACLAAVLLVAGRSHSWKTEPSAPDPGRMEEEIYLGSDEGEGVMEDNASGSLKEGTTYQELYQSFCKSWEKQAKMSTEGERGQELEETQEAAAEEDPIALGIEMGMDATDDAAADAAAGSTSEGQAELSGDYGRTNQQEEGVEEADIIKNDGRYLYRPITIDYGAGREAVQITDTKGGLQRAALIRGFSGGRINEIYVWKDTLVVVETGWADTGSGTAEGVVRDDVAYEGSQAPFSRIHIYDIKDRTKPKKFHEFTIKGSYQDSRISDGYLYLFAGYDASKPRMEMDYRAYVPEVDNEPLEEGRIYLPEETEDTSYLVMASIDMGQPDAFTDTKAIVCQPGHFYVSTGNIYIANTSYAGHSQEGTVSDSTRIYRFSYQDGKMEKEAEGTVKGTLRDDFAMNEHKGYLRLVTTVEEVTVSKVVDDITGEEIGTSSVGMPDANSLYVLDMDLEVAGKIENLAKDEKVYSARFMGDTGYFVTFRQVDPLFSVDLSNPQEPKILGELKISGFSEYLHFYTGSQLLGIGMEADENTGATDGLKLTMFDISDPADVKAQSTMHLEEYGYANALYDYKAVLIDPGKNLFGFAAESYEGDYAVRYLLFSYEDGEFKKRMELECADLGTDGSDSLRGTYIGDVFYLMYGSGRVESYRLADGSKMGELLPPGED